MRIAISALLGMTFTFAAASVAAQPGNRSEVPPLPPPPGSIAPSEPPPPIPTPFPPERRDESTALAGWSDGFFLREPHDYFRLFPKLLVQTDVNGFFGPGVKSVPLADGGSGLKTRLLVRRARLALGGELLKRWSFLVSGELGGQTIGNAEVLAQSPGAATARYVPVQSATAAAGLADVWINYSIAPLLNFMIGQFNAPFSMENRTVDDFTPWMERNLPIRGFAVPYSKDLGGMIWGEIGQRVFNYEIGVFGGDGQNRPSVDNRVDFMGRFYAHPFASLGSSSLAKHTQIGLSLRHGDRDPKAVTYDYPAIATGQGYVLWRPTYTDGLGRLVHVIPSGGQNAIGGELRVRTDRFALQGEVYYVDNHTRESVDGHQAIYSERFGRVAGVAWYAQLSAWPVGDAFVQPDPGENQPRRLDLHRDSGERVLRGLELLAIAGGINAGYEGARRLGPNDTGTPDWAITVYQFGFGAQYWHTKHVRVAANYTAYLAPGSGDAAKNQVVMPSNLVVDKAGNAGTGKVLHELGGRVALSF